MLRWVVHAKGSSQLLLPACLCTGSIAGQGQGLLPLLHHLVADLPLAGALHRHLHQWLGLPAGSRCTVSKLSLLSQLELQLAIHSLHEMLSA